MEWCYNVCVIASNVYTIVVWYHHAQGGTNDIMPGGQHDLVLRSSVAFFSNGLASACNAMHAPAFLDRTF